VGLEFGTAIINTWISFSSTTADKKGIRMDNPGITPSYSLLNEPSSPVLMKIKKPKYFPLN